MKKLLFGMAFMGAMMFSSVGSFGQGSVDPGGDEKWVCCQEADVFCQDWLGGAWSDSIKKPGPFCP
ncbi:hypothetical protein SAMN04489724_1599 [Algoriphagus locisalis]|uniref:Natural product n=1 Tax=Algoriphagus locisalis TaxID=305507 RepID=A0A1I7A0S1_9BACT|nr:hypothetical protein [Algoriphagus locisalis]SFT68491.1 hypothetical protein SAMN04489724_1599 [Algoriphagus locisalis]